MKSEIPKEALTMRTPFPDRLINKLPKGTKAQNECPATEKVSCKICGGWHHPNINHLDYVGHAALTDRLLDVDINWNWEPVAYNADGLPAFDLRGGLWIWLTVNGIKRLGYGNAPDKTFMDIGAREKEVIGDALRNAAMRFGAALDLWFKGELHPDEAEEKKQPEPKLINTIKVKGADLKAFDPTKEYIEQGQHAGLLYSQVPIDYLQWMSKQKGADRAKAIATLAYLDASNKQIPVQDAFEGAFDAEISQEDNDKYETLKQAIDTQKKTDLLKWGEKNAENIKKLPPTLLKKLKEYYMSKLPSKTKGVKK